MGPKAQAQAATKVAATAPRAQAQEWAHKVQAQAVIKVAATAPRAQAQE